jgi:hypothetical protein
MNTKYQPRMPKTSGAGSELLMAFLLVLALAQIALCFNAGAGLVRLDAPARLDSAISASKVHTPLLHGMNGLTNAQSSGFHSVPARG